MSNDTTPGFATAPPTTSSSEGSTPIKERAQTAKEETGKVASEAKSQAKKLTDQAKSELSDQAGAQQQRLAAGIRSVGDELSAMGSAQAGGGIASEVASQIGTRASDVADWFENRDPGSVLNEVKRFARQRPVVFIGVAAVAGILAGRLTRSIVEVANDESDSSGSGESNTTTSVPQSAPGRTAATTPAPAAGVAEPVQVPAPGTPLADQAWAETHR